MDKRAKILKQKRRCEKSTQRKNEERALIAAFEKRCKESGVRLPKSREEILRAYREKESEVIRLSILTSSIATLVALHRLWGFGKTRLYRMAIEFTMRIGNVGQNERKVSQMSDDLILDAGLDCESEWQGVMIDKPKGNPYEVKAMLESIPHTIPVIMYAVHYSLGFKRRRMKRLHTYTKDLIIKTLKENSLNILIDELFNIGLMVNMTGQYKAKGKGIAKEHDKFMRITGGYKK